MTRCKRVPLFWPLFVLLMSVQLLEGSIYGGPGNFPAQPGSKPAGSGTTGQPKASQPGPATSPSQSNSATGSTGSSKANTDTNSQAPASNSQASQSFSQHPLNRGQWPQVSVVYDSSPTDIDFTGMKLLGDKQARLGYAVAKDLAKAHLLAKGGSVNILSLLKSVSSLVSAHESLLSAVWPLSASFVETHAPDGEYDVPRFPQIVIDLEDVDSHGKRSDFLVDRTVNFQISKANGILGLRYDMRHQSLLVLSEAFKVMHHLGTRIASVLKYVPHHYSKRIAIHRPDGTTLRPATYVPIQLADVRELPVSGPLGVSPGQYRIAESIPSLPGKRPRMIGTLDVDKSAMGEVGDAVDNSQASQLSMGGQKDQAGVQPGVGLIDKTQEKINEWLNSGNQGNEITGTSSPWDPLVFQVGEVLNSGYPVQTVPLEEIGKALKLVLKASTLKETSFPLTGAGTSSGGAGSGATSASGGSASGKPVSSKPPGPPPLMQQLLLALVKEVGAGGRRAARAISALIDFVKNHEPNVLMFIKTSPLLIVLKTLMRRESTPDYVKGLAGTLVNLIFNMPVSFEISDKSTQGYGHVNIQVPRSSRQFASDKLNSAIDALATLNDIS